MKIRGARFERIFFLALSAVFLFASLLAAVESHRVTPRNLRVHYGLDHLPQALLLTGCFLFLVGGSTYLLRENLIPHLKLLETRSHSVFLLVIVALFAAFWLPVVLAGGFAQDDWLLLAAAAVRKSIYFHPALSWFALDSVDGNFRPLGTVLFPTFLLHWFGVNSVMFLAANFITNLASCIVAFFIVRQLTYSKLTAAVASILYLSRDLNYTDNAWFCALGDALAILFGGLAVLASLRGLTSSGWRAALLYCGGFACFFVAMLGKQSAFAVALIVPMVFYFRPGSDTLESSWKRLRSAGIALVVYAGAVLFLYLHAKSLLGERTPYRLSAGLASIEAAFAYLSWYFAGLQVLQGRLALSLSALLGFIIVAALVALARRFPHSPRSSLRTLVFLLLASVVSLAPVLPLAPRVAPYYSSMFAFWFSMALAVWLVPLCVEVPGSMQSRKFRFALCLLVTLGFATVRLKQTALIPSGGYLWGTFGMDQNGREYRAIAAALHQSPQARTLVLVDFPYSLGYYASMALLADPGLTRIVAYDSTSATFFVNDRNGKTPEDRVAAFSDPDAFHWRFAVAPSQPAELLDPSTTLWLGIHDADVFPVQPLSTPAAE